MLLFIPNSQFAIQYNPCFFCSWFVLLFFIVPFFRHSRYYYRISYRKYWDSEIPAIGYLPDNKPTLIHYLGSNPNVPYLILITASIPAYLRIEHAYYPQGLPTSLQALLLTILPACFYMVIRLIQKAPREETMLQIAFFRKFNARVSYGLRAGILPTLAPYGYVKVIADQSLREELMETPAPSSLLPSWSQVYNGERHIEMFDTTDVNWKFNVQALIRESEVAILDITHLSDALAWELDQCLTWLNRPGEPPRSNLSAIVLVCNINYLGANLETVYSTLINKLAQQKGLPSSWIYARIPRPLTYVNFHMTPFFAWRLYQVFRQLSTSPR